jgi:hypothetical protein
MKRLLPLLAVLALALASTAAQARPHHHYRHYRHYAHHRLNPVVQTLGIGLGHMLDSVNRHAGYSDPADVSPYPWPSHGRTFAVPSFPPQPAPVYGGFRPRDCYGIPWCGCFVRHKLGIADVAYNLARNWFHWGRPSGPCIGCVAVSYRHVGLIVGNQGGQWIVEQGNPYRYGPDSLRWAVAYRSP